ncbi:hypothetical protein DV735_g1487, partial [Chaetothyriales sp. CBS 134920]
MADDSSYAAFLNKANADLSSSSSSHQKPSSHTTATAKTASTAIPAPLKPIVHNDSHTYTSDTDSQWEPFKTAISTTAEVEELQVAEFDPQKQYSHVIDAVKQAAGGDDPAAQVKIFRLQVDRTRVEYYIVSVSHTRPAADKELLVGVVAKAVES